MGAAEAGWKGGAHEKVSNAKFFRAYWFIPEYGELFLALWYCYLRQIVDIERSHPFAFVNTWREPLGSEYKLGQFNKAHAAAVERIGLNVSKADGTTPHGHRHRYGRLAAKAGIDPEIRRRMFHHLSPESQGVYTTPTELEIFQELTKAKDTLDNGVALAAEIREATTFFSMD
jgi:integrase